MAAQRMLESLLESETEQERDSPNFQAMFEAVEKIHAEIEVMETKYHILIGKMEEYFIDPDTQEGMLQALYHRLVKVTLKLYRQKFAEYQKTQLEVSGLVGKIMDLGAELTDLLQQKVQQDEDSTEE